MAVTTTTIPGCLYVPPGQVLDVGCAGGSHPSSCVYVNISCRCSGGPDSFFLTINDKEYVRIKKGLIFFCAQSRSVSSCTAAVVALVQYSQNWGLRSGGEEEVGDLKNRYCPKSYSLMEWSALNPSEKNILGISASWFFSSCTSLSWPHYWQEQWYWDLVIS